MSPTGGVTFANEMIGRGDLHRIEPLTVTPEAPAVRVRLDGEVLSSRTKPTKNKTLLGASLNCVEDGAAPSPSPSPSHRFAGS